MAHKPGACDVSEAFSRIEYAPCTSIRRQYRLVRSGDGGVWPPSEGSLLVKGCGFAGIPNTNGSTHCL